VVHSTCDILGGCCFDDVVYDDPAGGCCIVVVFRLIGGVVSRLSIDEILYGGGVCEWSGINEFSDGVVLRIGGLLWT
jgi:hypothetical protein